MFHRLRILPVFAAVVVASLVPWSHARAQDEIKGVRVFYSGHSFHYFMPNILSDIAKKAGVKDHTHVGLSAIGGSRVIQHWNVPQTTIAAGSDGSTLPAETIHVGSTKGFGPKGTIAIRTSKGITAFVYTAKTETSFTGCKGGAGKLAKGDIVGNVMKDALRSATVDVLTMAPIYLPDPGIENFVKLAVEKNPRIRIFVQENWLPFDQYEPTFKKRPKQVDHNAPTGASLRKMHEPYFQSIEAHVQELNKKYKTHAVRVAPVGQAVILLREKIIAGQAPGLSKQSDLFGDAIGHARPPLQALVAYCYYGLIYQRSPAGLPIPAVLGKAKRDDTAKLNRLLQEIAWQTVSEHPMTGLKAR